MKLNDFNQPSRKFAKTLREMHDTQACGHDQEPDHEVNMAKADLYKLARYSVKLHDMLTRVSEHEGLQGWQQAKITKAADYISAVYHSLDYDQKFEEQADLAEADMRDPPWIGLSGEDYADMTSGRRRSRGEPDDSPRDPNDYSDLSKEVQYEIEAEKRRKKYEEKFKTEKDWQEGDAPNGKEYNLRYIVTSDDPDIIKNELYKFQNSHDYYMRKLVDTEIRPGVGIGYYMDVNSWKIPVKPRKPAGETPTQESTQIQELTGVKSMIKNVRRTFTRSDLNSRIEQALKLADEAFRIGDVDTGREHFNRYMRLIKLSQGHEKPVAERSTLKNIKRAVTGTDITSRVKDELNQAGDASERGDEKEAKKRFRRYDRLQTVGQKSKDEAEKIDELFGFGKKKPAPTPSARREVKPLRVISREPTPKFAAVSTKSMPVINVDNITTEKEWMERWREVNKLQLSVPSADRNTITSIQRTKGVLLRKAEELGIRVPGITENKKKPGKAQ